MNSTLEQTTTDFSKHLRKTYNWFSSVFVKKLQEACLEFFGLDLDFKLFSISENSNVLFKGDRYFVTRIKYNKNLDVTIRLSQVAVNKLLDETLGKGEAPFVIEDLSELEAKIITSFNDFLYSGIKKVLVTKDKIDKSELPKSLCHMVFYIDFQGIDFGKLVITIPTNILLPQEVAPANEEFSLKDFKNSKTELKIKVGASKLSLGEVKGIQPDDILLLEDSDIYTMTICNGAEELKFKLNPDPSIILNTGNEGEDMTENTVSAANMWDSIQVDINAEFEKVKISLGELKQISEGLVVDIGSIYDNRIDLKVENKIVARGELVIINDRYGVRVDEVIHEPEEEQDIPLQSQESVHVAQPVKEQINEQEFEDDDFNYDDFDENNEI